MTLNEILKKYSAPSLKEILATNDYERIRSWVLYHITGWLLVGAMFGSIITCELMRRGLIPL